MYKVFICSSCFGDGLIYAFDNGRKIRIFCSHCGGSGIKKVKIKDDSKTKRLS